MMAPSQNHSAKSAAALVLSLALALALGGCATSAANMAAKQPEAKDLTVLKKGTPRDKIVARLGAPETTTPTGNLTVDVYRFIQGYSAGARTARVFAHSTLSIATLGLWEVTGQAIEGYARGNEVSVRVIYDEQNMVKDYAVLDGADSVDVPLTATEASAEVEKTPDDAPPPPYATASH